MCENQTNFENNTSNSSDLFQQMSFLGKNARVAAANLALVSTGIKIAGLKFAAQSIRDSQEIILNANKIDIANARNNKIPEPIIERLFLDNTRIEAMAKGLEDISGLPDPVGSIISSWERPNGLKISRVRVPLGVIGIIYESRPNVTADAGGLCLMSGNAALLRGGSESFFSSCAIVEVMKSAFHSVGLPDNIIQFIPTTDRAAVGIMLTMSDFIDVIIPRGGKSLIQRVANESRIPVIKHLDGICHVYIDSAADLEKACNVTFNAKLRRTSVCGATETLLINQDVVSTHLLPILEVLISGGCEIRGDRMICSCDPRVIPAIEEDWKTEYLDAIISVKVVKDVDEAVHHINHYGSHHTDCIITEDQYVAERFLNNVDSSIVLLNASTQFADGGEFGMGAEIGISTGKLHARGPVGAEQLTSYKYVVRGTGQCRS
ncbi:Gamma-glutamyl phosphate reductase [Azospirillaceae bacterium]